MEQRVENRNSGPMSDGDGTETVEKSDHKTVWTTALYLGTD